MEEIGLNSYIPDQNISAEVDVSIETHWKSLSGSPPLTSTKLRSQRTAAIHRGIVPAKNIDKHDFAINGAIVRTLAISSAPELNVVLVHVE